MESEPLTTKLDRSWVIRLFGKSVLQRTVLRQIEQMLGPTRGQNCLLVNGESAGLALHLCAGDGAWHSVHLNRDVASVLKERDGKRAIWITNYKLPFMDHTFDALVVHDFLERQDDPQPFIEECHRVLKASGRLVINVPHAKRWALTRSVQRLLGLARAERSAPARSYSPTQLFAVVKDGFDVEDERTYSRFFLELTESIVELVIDYAVFGFRRRSEADRDREPGHVLEQAYRVRTWLYPCLVVAHALDHLLFFTSGYYLVSRAKRRIWRPRRAPVLSDGRSIADAAINTRIGTAGPFPRG